MLFQPNDSSDKFCSSQLVGSRLLLKSSVSQPGFRSPLLVVTPETMKLVYRNYVMPQNIPNMPRNIAEIFSPAFGRIGVIAVRCYLPLSDLVISHLRLYSVVLCLFVSFLLHSRLTGGDRTFRFCQLFFWLCKCSLT